MGGKIEFDIFETHFFEFVSELQHLSQTVIRLREEASHESSRAESAEAAREATQRALDEAQVEGSAVAAAAEKASAERVKLQQELVTLKRNQELAERERSHLEERCAELASKVNATNRDLDAARIKEATYAAHRDQLLNLSTRVQQTAKDVQGAVERLEAELRRVERSAASGLELRERARLAAAAHTRHRLQADAEITNTTAELLKANAENASLKLQLNKLQKRLQELSGMHEATKGRENATIEELKASLEAERAGATRLERALAAAVADNAALASAASASDAAAAAAAKAEASTTTPLTTLPVNTNMPPQIKALDSFLQ